MAIRNDAGLMLFFLFLLFSYLGKEEERMCSGWWRQGSMEKPGVFSIGADFE